MIDYSLSRGRAKIGEIEFIKALHVAEIPIDWLVNEDTLSKYRQMRSTQDVTTKSVQLPPPPPLVYHAPQPIIKNHEETPIIDDRQETPPPPKLDYYGPASNSIPAEKLTNVGPIKTREKQRASPYPQRQWITKHGTV